MKFILVVLLLFSASVSACPHAVRHESTKLAFAKLHACPATGKHAIHCPGYVIDHKGPLCAGFPDAPSNMAWEEYKESKRKDKEELHLCKVVPKGSCAAPTFVCSQPAGQWPLLKKALCESGHR